MRAADPNPSRATPAAPTGGAAETPTSDASKVWRPTSDAAGVYRPTTAALGTGPAWVHAAPDSTPSIAITDKVGTIELGRTAASAAPAAGGVAEAGWALRRAIRAEIDAAPDLTAALARLRSAHKLPAEMTDSACVIHAADHELDREIILAGAQRAEVDQRLRAAQFGLERDGALALLADLAVASVVSHGQIARAARLDALEVRAAVADAEARAEARGHKLDAAPGRVDAGAVREFVSSVTKLCDSVLGNVYLGPYDEEELAHAVKDEAGDIDDALATAGGDGSAGDGWCFDMTKAPRDGSKVDLWAKGRRWADSRYDPPGEFFDRPRWLVFDSEDRTCSLPTNPEHFDAPEAWRLPTPPTAQPESAK